MSEMMLTLWFFCSFLAMSGVHIAAESDRCTTITVGAKASSTGVPMTTHTADCSTCDFRIGKVPKKTYPKGAMRDVVLFRLEYPRYVGSARGETFELEKVDTSFNNWTITPAMGQIPQVNETYGYVSGVYGIMNEHQLSFGESTCAARLVSKPISAGGYALFDIAELTNVALERAKTAREAIRVMGDLATTYGYYGAVWEGEIAFLEAGEALTICDTKESWVFHILPDDTGKSAVWAAQRVPENHISVVANQFVIHHINLSDSDNYMGSADMQDVAIRAKLFDPKVDGEFDFTKAFAMPLIPDQYYATRRVWRVFSLSNPNLNISPYTDKFASDYPFSVEPSSTLTPMDLMRYQRDHYEGTEFDMTKGAEAGPYGNPDRYDISSNGNMTREVALTGHFERAISIFRATYSFISMASNTSAINAHILFGPYAPHAASYCPIYVQAKRVPDLYVSGSLHSFDMANTAYWVFSIVGNWVSHFYMYAIPLVQTVQNTLEQNILNSQVTIHQTAQDIYYKEGLIPAREYLYNTSVDLAKTTHVAYLKLFHDLVTTFHDGYTVSNITKYDKIQAKSAFYPEWWLKEVGYFNSENLQQVDMPTFITSNEGASTMLYMGSVLCMALICMALGFGIGMQYYHRQKQGYASIA